MPLKNISGQSYEVTIRTLGSSLVDIKMSDFEANNKTILACLQDVCKLKNTASNLKQDYQNYIF